MRLRGLTHVTPGRKVDRRLAAGPPTLEPCFPGSSSSSTSMPQARSSLARAFPVPAACRPRPHNQAQSVYNGTHTTERPHTHVACNSTWSELQCMLMPTVVGLSQGSGLSDQDDSPDGRMLATCVALCHFWPCMYVHEHVLTINQSRSHQHLFVAIPGGRGPLAAEPPVGSPPSPNTSSRPPRLR